MASVTLTDIRKSFGSAEVIHGVSLHVEDGEFVSLVGPSGCGKSTILRMVAGLEKISGGTITIGERVVNGVPPKDRDVAMVFQNYALYPHMSVFDNMAFSLKQRRVAKAEIAERVNRAADILGLADMLDRHPRQLSGGQRQRVAMGRAIVRNPQLFLFDEPLSNLDAKLRVQMRAEIKQLSRRLGTTAIYVTHDQIEAMTMSDRIVVLNGGNVEQIGAPLDLYDRPANMFVAQFIGSPSMNFFQGRLEGGSQGPVFRAEDGTAFPFTAGAVDASPRNAVLGVRPEHWRVTGDDSGIPAQVSVVEPTGADLHLRCAMAGQGIDVVLTERLPCNPEETLYLTCPAEQIHVFDPETRQRIG